MYVCTWMQYMQRSDKHIVSVTGVIITIVTHLLLMVDTGLRSSGGARSIHNQLLKHLYCPETCISWQTLHNHSLESWSDHSESLRAVRVPTINAFTAIKATSSHLLLGLWFWLPSTEPCVVIGIAVSVNNNSWVRLTCPVILGLKVVPYQNKSTRI